MDPSPSGPYQSRVLRAVVNQTRRLVERSQTTLRRAKVAASWSAQILLYPVYAVFQTTRLLGQQFSNTVRQEANESELDEQAAFEIPLAPSPAEITSDTPLFQVLKAVQGLAIRDCLPVGLPESEVSIRAIASLRDTKALVLVTNYNHILDVLSPEQQHTLYQRIVLESATYARAQRAWKLPKPIARFLQGVKSRIPFLKEKPKTLSAPRVLSAPKVGILALPPDADVPIQRSLTVVRTFLSETDPTPLDEPISPDLPISAAGLDFPKPVFVRGVASLLNTRSLVLVTSLNELLDVLNPAQQTFIEERITWEVANYLHVVHEHEQLPGLQPLQLPSETSPVFPIVRAFYQLMAWMQSGAVAISTNLFQETSYQPAATLPNSHPPASLPPSRIPTAPQSPLHAWQNQLNQVRQRLISAITRSPIATSEPKSTLAKRDRKVLSKFRPNQRQGSLTSGNLVDLSKPAIAHSNTAIHPKTNSPSNIQSASVQGAIATAPSTHLLEQPQSTSFIDTQFTLLGYEPSLLERIVRLIDRCFVWLETLLSNVWKWLTGAESKG